MKLSWHYNKQMHTKIVPPFSNINILMFSNDNKAI